jgi:hypothetical protein
MEKLHSVTRPVWATGWKDAVVLFLSLACSVSATTFFSQSIKKLLAPIIVHDSLEQATPWIVDIILTLASLAFGGLVFWYYRWRKTKSYPETYVYVFKRDFDKTNLVGSFELTCDKYRGAIYAEGAAYDWRGSAPDPATRTIWESMHVGAAEVRENRSTCYIVFKFREEFQARRPYTHGLLSFTEQKGEKGIVNFGTVYRGHIHAIEPPDSAAQSPIGGLHFYAYAYAERINTTLSETDMENLLRDKGAALLARRDHHQ